MSLDSDSLKVGVKTSGMLFLLRRKKKEKPLKLNHEIFTFTTTLIQTKGPIKFTDTA